MSDLYEDRDSGSSSENNRTSDPSLKENEGNAETASSSEQHVDEKTTYSWVNPKLRQSGSDQTENNPWSGGGDGNYWRYSDDRGNGTGMDRKGRRNLDQDHQVKRPRRSGRHWTTVIAMAVVFGLIAGLVAYGVNYIGNRIHPVYSTASAGENADKKDLSGEKEPEKSENVSASSETAVSSDIPTTGKQQDMSVAEVASVAMPSLVTISTMSVEEMQSFFGGTQKYQVQGAGTGVIIGENDSELLIATNNHVIEGATQVSVGFVDESVISAQIKGFDEDHDLAVVAVKLSDISEVTRSQIRVATVGDSDALVLGQQVVAIGNALGYGQSVTSGYVSALNRSLQLSDGTNTFTSDGLIQTDAAINSGNSGGALLNMKGELVGINEAKRSGNGQQASVDNVGFAIPMAKAEPILEELMNENTREQLEDDKRGYLGITCADVTSEYSQIYNMPEGVCVTSVVSGGPADQAGIRKGDVITKFDGKSVTSYSKLENRLKYYSSGEEVTVAIQRASGSTYKEQTVKVTLGTSDAISSIPNSDTQGSGQDNNSGIPGTEPGGNNNSGDIFGQIFGY
ncbi:MAG: trypsin-like peptidase domain-containing protein [Bilifractor sp.]|nr:trypsin-like peptidase domain-containing protein [Lachnospiraceae bacterium]MDY2838482.1 trypsin-like peptidase domain-containing protein [Bilifractor sp.]